jgi:hypothetical protein
VLDVTPLKGYSRMSSLSTDLDTLSVTLLSSDAFTHDGEFIDVSFNAPVSYSSLDAIDQVLSYITPYEGSWKIIHLFHQAISLLELAWIGFLDIEVRPVLSYILLERDKKAFISEIKNRMISFIDTQVERNGTTIGLNLEQIKNESGILTRKIDRIIELRKKEMMGIFIPVEESIADLKPLWLTAYGYDLLKALGYGTTCTTKELEIVKRALREIGFTLQTTDDTSIELDTAVSEGLRDYIWYLADFSFPDADEKS